MVAHAFNPSTGEAEVGGGPLWVWGHPSLQSEFQDTMATQWKSVSENKQKENKTICSNL